MAASPRFSSFTSGRLRAALWGAALAAAIVFALVLVLGAGSSSPAPTVSPQRKAVGAYLTRVDRIELAAADKVRAIDQAYKAFAKQPHALGSHAPRYRAARRTLAALRDRLRAVEPPKPARKLHALLLELMDDNVAMAGSVAGLAAYLPALSKARAPLADAVASLRTAVSRAASASAQADAFDAFAASTGGAAAAVERLAPPPYFVRSRAAVLSQLRRLTATAQAIAAALRAKQPATAQTLVSRLARIETETAVARAQRSGAAAFDAALKRIAGLEKQLEHERTRLEKRLPA